MRNWVAIALLFVLGLIAEQMFKEGEKEDRDTFNTILAADRACEAQTGQRCD